MKTLAHKLITSVCLLLISVPNTLAKEINLIAFGSCAEEQKEQPIWNVIAKDEPQLFLMIGDNIYPDQQFVSGELTYKPVDEPQRFQHSYEVLGSKAGFIKLKENTPILAMWDDHDFGQNDGGKNYFLKQESKKAFLDFWGTNGNQSLYEQDGVYQSKIFGENGKRVQIILLDTRFNRDDLKIKPSENLPGRYVPTYDQGANMLGPTQWDWLEEQLRIPAEVRIIVSGIQVVADHLGFESWQLMPKQRQRLYDLISKTKANGVFFISGDRHLTEVSVDKGIYDSFVPYPMWDFTSSGLTQETVNVNKPNKYRVGSVFRKANYGLVKIDWKDTTSETVIEFLSKDSNSKVLISQKINLGDLQI